MIHGLPHGNRPMRKSAAKPVLACLLLLAGHGARAEMPPNGVAANDANIAAFDALARGEQARGTLPRWSNAADQPALAALWNHSASLGRPPYHAADIPPLLDVLNKQLRVFKFYVQFAAASGTAPDPDANAILFQDEIARSGAFMATISAALMTAFGDFWDHLPEQERTEIRKQGLRQARHGQVQLVSGMALILGSPDLRPDNAAILADSLGRNGAALAGALTPSDRAALVAAVQRAGAGLASAAQAQVTDFVAAMSNPACKGLCTVE